MKTEHNGEIDMTEQRTVSVGEVGVLTLDNPSSSDGIPVFFHNPTRQCWGPTESVWDPSSQEYRTPERIVWTRFEHRQVPDLVAIWLSSIQYPEHMTRILIKRGKVKRPWKKTERNFRLKLRREEIDGRYEDRKSTR